MVLADEKSQTSKRVGPEVKARESGTGAIWSWLTGVRGQHLGQEEDRGGQSFVPETVSSSVAAVPLNLQVRACGRG